MGYSGNKKIRNAQKCELDGIKFDSRLEMRAYSAFKMHNIAFDLKPYFILQEGFRYENAAIRPITLTFDFFLTTHKMLVDTKGYPNDVFPLKLKMLKRYLLDKGVEPRIRIIKNVKELDAFCYSLTHPHQDVK